MKKEAFSSPFRKVAPALAAVALLAVGAPAQAQWLVQDNNLYKLVNKGIVEKIAVSGDGKGSFQSSSKNLKNQLKSKVTGALGLNNKKFDELVFDTEELLSRNKEDSASQLQVLAKSSLLGGIGNSIVGSITGKETYSSDAHDFFKGSDAACNSNSNEEVFVQCMHMRNILGSQLKEIQDISKVLEERNLALQGVMAEKYKTPGELQKKQYEISVLQTVIANDQMRLQAALASYQAMRDLYKEKYNEAVHARQNGSKKLKDKAAVIAGAAAGQAVFEATKTMVDKELNPQIFGKK